MSKAALSLLKEIISLKKKGAVDYSILLNESLSERAFFTSFSSISSPSLLKEETQPKPQLKPIPEKKPEETNKIKENDEEKERNDKIIISMVFVNYCIISPLIHLSLFLFYFLSLY